MEKLVASNSLDDTDRWANSTLLQGELVAAVRDRLHRQDVLVTGSASVVDQLVAHDLVDEFRLLVFPTVVGKGRRLFDGATLDLDLASSEDAGSGVLRQIYEREGTRCATHS